MQIIKYFSLLIILLWVIFYAVARWQDPEVLNIEDARDPASSGQLARLSAGNTFYELQGPENAPLVILVHGFAIGSHLWDGTFDRLVADGFRVLRFDLYGRGFSDRPDVIYDKDLFVNQLRALLQTLAITEPFHLVGISMGALVAAEFAANEPLKITTLTLLSPLSQRQDVALFQLPLLADPLAIVLMRTQLTKHIENMVYLPVAELDTIKTRFLDEIMVKDTRKSLLSTARHLLADNHLDTYQQLGQQNIPTLLIWGKQDIVTPYSESAKLLAILPGAEMLSLDNVGHAPHLEASEQVDDRLRQHLTQKATD
ncbi:alpha/beta fold hydrolase [Methylophaga sp.]|uniref:alpha/beta fold hydrolase n=1 Tax=Methylophaga sp. TaxID=2024840 RepID=UPI0025F6036A|nr:alpha/beta fold hydrolase [Methylophaga sp.]